MAAYTLVYDGTCRVCQRLVRGLERWDSHRQIEMIPSQAPGVHARFPSIPPEAYDESMQLIRLSDGKVWQGAAALDQMLDVLPKGCLFSWIFSIPFVRPLAERFYRWFARKRHRFGCDEHCAIR